MVRMGVRPLQADGCSLSPRSADARHRGGAVERVVGRVMRRRVSYVPLASTLSQHAIRDARRGAPRVRACGNDSSGLAQETNAALAAAVRVEGV